MYLMDNENIQNLRIIEGADSRENLSLEKLEGCPSAS
jgi:hypothetical protein